MRVFFLAVFLLPQYLFPQTPNGKLYFFTVPGGAIPAYLGYIEYPEENYVAFDSMLFDQFADIALIEGKLFAALLDDVAGYDTATHTRNVTVHGASANRIAGWNGKLAAISQLTPHFRVYDIASDSMIFSLDTSKLPFPPTDFAIWNNKAFVLMQHSVIIVDLILRDTLATIPTPHPYLNQDMNYHLIDAGADFYIDVEYATGGLRFSLLKMNKTTYNVETMFHHEGYANYHVPVVAGDKIYFDAFDTHYSISDDSLRITNYTDAPRPVEYDDKSESLFLYSHSPNRISYFTGSVFSDTLLIPYYLSRALFVPAADLPNAIAHRDDGRLTVYPNPASEFVRIELPEYSQIKEARVYDIAGKLVEAARSLTIDSPFTFNISSLPPGFYYIKVSTQREIFSERFMKE